MMLIGLRGLGDAALDVANCVSDCDNAFNDSNSNAFQDPTILSKCTAGCNTKYASGANSGGASSSDSSSWWSTALTSLVKGAASGLVTPGGVCPPGSVGNYPACSCLPGSPGTYPTCLQAPTPFYATPLGILGIVALLGFGVYKLAK